MHALGLREAIKKPINVGQKNTGFGDAEKLPFVSTGRNKTWWLGMSTAMAMYPQGKWRALVWARSRINLQRALKLRINLYATGLGATLRYRQAFPFAAE